MVKKLILIVIVIIFAGAIGYYFWQDNFFSPRVTLGTNELDKLSILERPVNIMIDMPEDAQKIAIEKIEKLTDELKQDNSLLDNWILLGVYRKIIGDYEGAKECWEHAIIVNPQNSTLYNNLGDLYAHFLNDYKKAEENFLMAIKVDPGAIYVYRSLYEFYRYNLKDDTKARDILRQGMTANQTSSQDLQNLLDTY